MISSHFNLESLQKLCARTIFDQNIKNPSSTALRVGFIDDKGIASSTPFLRNAQISDRIRGRSSFNPKTNNNPVWIFDGGSGAKQIDGEWSHESEAKEESKIANFFHGLV